MNFSGAEEQAAFLEQYGEFFAGLLDEVLGLIEHGRLMPHQAKLQAKARFVTLMAEHVPASHKAVAKYQARVAAEEEEKTRLAVEYEARRQRLKQAEQTRQQELAAQSEAKRYGAYLQSRQDEKDQREKFAQEERARRDELDRKNREAAAEAERLLAAIGETKE